MRNIHTFLTVLLKPRLKPGGNGNVRECKNGDILTVPEV